MALPSVVFGYRATQGLEARPCERRSGPLGAISIGVAGLLVLLPGALGVIELLLGDDLPEERTGALLLAGFALLCAVALLVVFGVATRRRDLLSRPGFIAIAKAKSVLRWLIVGAIVLVLATFIT